MSMTVSSIATTLSSIQALSGTGTSAGGTASAGTAASAASSASAPEAAIVATLGGSGSQVQVYDGSGLLSQIRQIQAAGDAAASAYSSEASTSATASTASTASTSAPSGSTDVTANWATILKSRPELAGVAIGYAFEQGIVNTLSVQA